MWNPLTWIKLLSLAKSLIDLAVAGYQWVVGFLKKRAQQKKIDQLADAEHKIEDANKIEDETKRLEEKSNAACEMEAAFDPNKRCH